jgi:hypothetical protein
MQGYGILHDVNRDAQPASTPGCAAQALARAVNRHARCVLAGRPMGMAPGDAASAAASVAAARGDSLSKMRVCGHHKNRYCTSEEVLWL